MQILRVTRICIHLFNQILYQPTRPPFTGFPEIQNVRIPHVLPFILLTNKHKPLLRRHLGEYHILVGAIELILVQQLIEQHAIGATWA